MKDRKQTNDPELPSRYVSIGNQCIHFYSIHDFFPSVCVMSVYENNYPNILSKLRHVKSKPNVCKCEILTETVNELILHYWFMSLFSQGDCQF